MKQVVREGQEHLSVLVEEVVFLLSPRREGWMVDGTVGWGGHAEALLERAPAESRLLGIDEDPEAVACSRERLARFGSRVVLRRGNFRSLERLAREVGVDEAQAVLLDLGLSSFQLESPGRGFSFLTDEPLDMRFDSSRGMSAADLLASLPEAELARLLFECGGEPHARAIARRIVARRKARPILTTGELVQAVRAAVPRRAWSRRRHVATRTFQALRMTVNDEIAALTEGLPQAARLLAVGGRLGVISFHSGEDRIVKQAFRSLSQHGYTELFPSPVAPSPEERRANPRARSAKLRVLERVEADGVAA